ncbi:hypothetical protein [Candidatus Methanoprimaticola sp. MG2]|uniref:hypothetical protein n=1 Tax=Candidatus Methanoprimaticola sp. MG2 TaxID=3228838 RepID=UPI0039C61845
MAWAVNDIRRDVPVSRLSDDLKGPLEMVAEDVTGLDFDNIVGDNTVVGATPTSVDCIICKDGWVNFIEFKGDPFRDYIGDSEGKRRIKERIKLKAVESIYLYRKFLERSAPSNGYRLILVFKSDGFTDIVNMIGGDPEHREPPRWISRMGFKDLNGERMYYDSVILMSAEEFVRFSNRSLKSTGQ